MIQPLRTVHRGVFVALALILPATILVGLRARPPRQQSTVSPAQLPNSAHLLRKADASWQGKKIRSDFYDDSGRPGEIFLVVDPENRVAEPDLQLYWSADPPQGDAVPAHALLLGAFSPGKIFTLPMSPRRTGYLILFSLPHNTVFDTAKVEALP